MYQLPLKFIEVSPDVAICATRIVAVMSTRAYQARETIKAERKAGTLINGCGTKTAETAIFLDNGTVISSPYKIPRILKKILKADGKSVKNSRVKADGNIVYTDAEELDELADDDPMLDEEEFEHMTDE